MKKNTFSLFPQFLAGIIVTVTYGRICPRDKSRVVAKVVQEVSFIDLDSVTDMLALRSQWSYFSLNQCFPDGAYTPQGAS